MKLSQENGDEIFSLQKVANTLFWREKWTLEFNFGQFIINHIILHDILILWWLFLYLELSDTHFFCVCVWNNYH